jgi:simple sugar transport system permease protein
MLTGAVCGGLWAAVPGLLKVHRGCSEVVTTLMFNYISAFFTEYLVRVPFYVPGAVGESGSTNNIPEGIHLTTLISGSELTTEFFFGLALTAIVAFRYAKTISGYEVQIVGNNAILAKYIGIPVLRRQASVMALSGAIAGFAGALEVLGVFHRFIIRFSPGVGFDGIVVSLIGGNNPLLIPLASLGYAALKSGSKAMEMFGDVPRVLVDILMGVVIVVITIKKYPSFARGLFKKKEPFQEISER